MKIKRATLHRDLRRDVGASGEGQRGAVLMEVVLALILFVGAAAILSGGMNASIQTVDRMRLTMHASNLASSILAETRMGLRSAVTTGETPFDAPFEEWTWEMEATEVISVSDEIGEGTKEAAAGSLARLEVTIRHGFESIVYRLVQVVPVAESSASDDRTGGGDLFGPGFTDEEVAP